MDSVNTNGKTQISPHRKRKVTDDNSKMNERTHQKKNAAAAAAFRSLPFEVRMARAEEKRKLNILRLKRQQWERHLGAMTPEERRTRGGSTSSGASSSSKAMLLMDKLGRNNYNQLTAKEKKEKKEKQDNMINRLVNSKKGLIEAMNEKRKRNQMYDPKTGRKRFTPVVNKNSQKMMKMKLDRHSTGVSIMPPSLPTAEAETETETETTDAITTGKVNVSESLYRNAFNQRVSHFCLYPFEGTKTDHFLFFIIAGSKTTNTTS
jgi:hypothetical protein